MTMPEQYHRHPKARPPSLHWETQCVCNGAYYTSNFNRLLVPRTVLPALLPASGDSFSQSSDNVAILRPSDGVKGRNSRGSWTNVDSLLEYYTGNRSLHLPLRRSRQARAYLDRYVPYHHVTDTLVDRVSIWNTSQPAHMRMTSFAMFAHG
ncbi:hypothetical protein EJ03DRAFT_18034 [Teratosphaeria nubilosa]|uniref:Uncharacterized protein n=1 Tax=Teratosphaeria nubilosa TaxID=161662 RepID=A0A6G1KVM6_9PEZI|nr:hypothetical protein EJ03DRAFT_18034 [Teratosphaeria nubilosa]